MQKFNFQHLACWRPSEITDWPSFRGWARNWQVTPAAQCVCYQSMSKPSALVGTFLTDYCRMLRFLRRFIPAEQARRPGRSSTNIQTDSVLSNKGLNDCLFSLYIVLDIAILNGIRTYLWGYRFRASYSIKSFDHIPILLSSSAVQIYFDTDFLYRSSLLIDLIYFGTSIAAQIRDKNGFTNHLSKRIFLAM